MAIVIVINNNEAKVDKDIAVVQYFEEDVECLETRTTVMIDRLLVLIQAAIVQDILKETHVHKQINQVLMVSSPVLIRASNNRVQSTNRNLKQKILKKFLVKMMRLYQLNQRGLSKLKK